MSEQKNGDKSALRILNTLMLAVCLGGIGWVGTSIENTKEKVIRLEAQVAYLTDRISALERRP